MKKDLQISDHIGSHKRIENKNQLGFYLAGLIEGDGYFGATKLEIAFHIKDKSTAYQLRRSLGFGQIYPYKGKQAIRFVISNSKGLKSIIELVNGKFVTDLKINQLLKHDYANRFHLEILPPLRSISLNNHWLVGFLDADGTIGIFIASSCTHKSKKSVRLEIKVSQKDSFIVDEIARIFQIRTVSRDRKGIYRLNITGKDRIHKMIDYLDNFNFQTMKYTQYGIFRRCARFMQAKKHLDFTGLFTVYKMKQRLQNVYK